MRLLWMGAVSPEALTLPPDRLKAAGSLQANGDGDRLQSRHRRADILAQTQSPSTPAPLSLQAPRAHADLHHSSLPGRRCRSRG